MLDRVGIELAKDFMGENFHPLSRSQMPIWVGSLIDLATIFLMYGTLILVPKSIVFI